MNRKTLAIIIIGLIVGSGILVIVGHPNREFNDDKWFGFLPFGEREEEEIIPPEPTIYNEQKAWTDVPIKIGAKNGYTWNHPVIPGLAVEIRDGSNTYIDGGNTGTDGTWTSTELFDSRDTYTLILGDIATTNKSQTYTFIVQGQGKFSKYFFVVFGLYGDSKPTSIPCGVFEYFPVAEESALAFAFYDENYVALTAINMTSTYTDKVVDGYVLATFSVSSTGFGRDLWSPTKGIAEAYLALVLTEYNSTTATAAHAVNTPGYMTMGSPTGKAVFVIKLSEIEYDVDEDSVVIPGSEALHWYRWQIDFSSCGIPSVYSASYTQCFTLSGVVSYEYDYTMFANGGAAYLSTWFSDTDLSAIVIST